MNEQFFPRMLRGARCGTVLLSLASISLTSQPCRAQVSARRPVSNTQNATPEPAIPAILKAFATFEVVGMEAAHGGKDIDDFILSLIRDLRFPATVNDIVVECGNVRYQPLLDRYIAGENVPFTEVQHVWRDTTVFQMCGTSGFYEELFPLVRAINQRLPATRRLRVVAADPPIDWSKIQTYEDLKPFVERDGKPFLVRDESIASVMEKEVLSKNRKALMLFGIFHLMHGSGPGEGDAVTIYERQYPGRTFVIDDFGGASNELLGDLSAPGGVWPSLVKTKNSKLGLLGLDAFIQSPIWTDENCNVSDAVPADPSKTIADRIDAFLYLGPQGLGLREPVPADIALDRAYRTEWLRRMKVVGLPASSTLDEMDAQTVAEAADPILTLPPTQPVSQEIRSRMKQACLNKKRSAANTAP